MAFAVRNENLCEKREISSIRDPFCEEKLIAFGIRFRQPVKIFFGFVAGVGSPLRKLNFGCSTVTGSVQEWVVCIKGSTLEIRTDVL